MEKTFAELFCSHRRLHPQQYHEVMFRCCLYRRTLIFRHLLAVFSRSYFEADHELISRVGLLTASETLDDEIDIFYNNSTNRSFLHRVLRLRVSARRVQRLFDALMRRGAYANRDDVLESIFKPVGHCEVGEVPTAI